MPCQPQHAEPRTETVNRKWRSNWPTSENEYKYLRKEHTFDIFMHCCAVMYCFSCKPAVCLNKYKRNTWKLQGLEITKDQCLSFRERDKAHALSHWDVIEGSRGQGQKGEKRRNHRTMMRMRGVHVLKNTVIYLLALPCLRSTSELWNWNKSWACFAFRWRIHKVPDAELLKAHHLNCAHNPHSLARGPTKTPNRGLLHPHILLQASREWLKVSIVV